MSAYGKAWDDFVEAAGGHRALAGYPYEVASRAFAAGYNAGLKWSDGGMPDGARRTRCQSCGWTFGTHAPDCDFHNRPEG